MKVSPSERGLALRIGAASNARAGLFDKRDRFSEGNARVSERASAREKDGKRERLATCVRACVPVEGPVVHERTHAPVYLHTLTIFPHLALLSLAPPPLPSFAIRACTYARTPQDDEVNGETDAFFGRARRVLTTGVRLKRHCERTTRFRSFRLHWPYRKRRKRRTTCRDESS